MKWIATIIFSLLSYGAVLAQDELDLPIPAYIFDSARNNVHLTIVKRFGGAVWSTALIQRIEPGKDLRVLPANAIDGNGRISIFLLPGNYYIYVLSHNCKRKGEAYKRFKLEVGDKPIRRRLRIKECRE